MLGRIVSCATQSLDADQIQDRLLFRIGGRNGTRIWNKGEADPLVTRLAWPIIQQRIREAGVQMQGPRLGERYLSCSSVGSFNEGYLVDVRLTFLTEETWEEAKQWLLPLFEANWPSEVQLLLIEEYQGFTS